MLAQTLISASAAIALVAGTLHLYATFYGPDLRPRDPELETRMRAVALNVTGRTSMWNAWIGFNAILSLGLMLFGLLYGYLAVAQFAVLRRSAFLLVVGLLFLASLVAIWKRFAYYAPVLVFSTALLLYAAGAATAAR